MKLLLPPFMLCLICIVSPTNPLLSQNQGLEAGFFLGGSTYRGDVVKPDIFTLKDTRLAYGAFARYSFSNQWQLRANLSMTKLAAEDRNYDTGWKDQRSFRFTTFVAEVSVLGEWHPLGAGFLNTKQTRSWSPYLFTGLGLAYFNPNPVFEQNKIDQLSDRIAADQNADYKKMHLTIPFGAGIRFQVNKIWSFALEGGARPAFTDYLDGISQAGMPDNDDWYGFGGILVGYRIGM